MWGTDEPCVYSKLFPTLSFRFLSTSGLQHHGASLLSRPFAVLAPTYPVLILPTMRPGRRAQAILTIPDFPSQPSFVSTARTEILGDPVQTLKVDDLKVAQTFLLKEMAYNFCDLHPSTGRSLPVCIPSSQTVNLS